MSYQNLPIRLTFELSREPHLPADCPPSVTITARVGGDWGGVHQWTVREYLPHDFVQSHFDLIFDAARQKLKHLMLANPEGK